MVRRGRLTYHINQGLSRTDALVCLLKMTNDTASFFKILFLIYKEVKEYLSV